jgi:glycosyltransferase involved in cell wall biosynthesis
MKKVLFIAYYFPPMGGSGVQRSLKFVKYMQDYGYLPVILTVNSLFTRWIKDKTMIHEIPLNVPIYRTFTIDMNWIYKVLWGLRLNRVVLWIQSNWVLPDSEITWICFAKKSIITIMKEHTIELAYITAPPFSAMLLGPYLKKKYNMRYLVDFRDEWSNNPYRNDSRMQAKAKSKELSMEKEVLSYCTGIVYTHPQYMKENFENKYPFLRNKKNRIISNGYDESDFTHADSFQRNRNVKMTIVYIGTFYGRRQPRCLWEAIYNLIESGKLVSDNIEIRIIGRNTKSFVLGQYANDNEVNKIVRVINNRPYAEALSELMKSDMLMLFIAPGNNSRAEIPGKLFEYIRTYKPIFAVIPPDGVAAEILQKSKTGIICDSSNAKDVEKCFLGAYQSWVNNNLYVEPDKEYIASYNRQSLTKELVSLFKEILAEESGNHASRIPN